MESSALAPHRVPSRRADRRAGLHTLVRQVAGALPTHEGGPDLVAELCTRLAALARARHVQVAENEGVRVGRPIVAADYVAFATPWRKGNRQPVIEASFAAGARPDEWTCQLVESAASLAAILMAGDRGPVSTFALRGSDRTEFGPLIGSSEVMEALRDRVERVASTFNHLSGPGRWEGRKLAKSMSERCLSVVEHPLRFSP